MRTAAWGGGFSRCVVICAPVVRASAQTRFAPSAMLPARSEGKRVERNGPRLRHRCAMPPKQRLEIADEHGDKP